MNQFPTRELPAAPAPPLWGQLAADGSTAAVVRFVTPGRTVSIPYHVILMWALESDTQLTIRTTSGDICIHGLRLGIIRDALDDGRLLQLKVTPERLAASDASSARITSIAFDLG